MAFIRNTDKLIEGSSKLFFSNVRAKAAVQSDLNDLSSSISSEQAARQSEDGGIKLRLGVIEGGAGVSGSIAKAQADAQAYADQKVAALVNSAPAVLDTLKELSDAIGGDASFASTVAGQIGAVDDKVDQEILDRQAAISSEASSRASAVSAEQSARQSADSALSGRIASLEADPVTKTYVDGIQSSLDSRLDILEQDETTKAYVDQQVAAEQSRAQGAEQALDGRLDILEANPTTKAYVDQQVSAEQSRAQGAESALDGRLDVLEQDPTTKAYVDGVQSALDGRLDALELDPVTKTYVEGAKSNLQGQITAEVSARQSAVSSEASARQSADQALDGRLDVLESDPTTKSYVDGEISSVEGQISQEISNRQSAVSGEQSRAQAAEAALDVRLDALELDPVSKTYVDGQVSGLQGQVNTEKGRVDAILSASQADKDSFAEIVQLINSVDASNDSAFAGYVTSNNAALAAEVSARQSAVSVEQSAREAADQALDGRLDALELDPVSKTYVDGEVSDLQGQITQEISDRQSAVSSEASARQSADNALDTRLDSLEADPTTKSYVDSKVTLLQSEDLTMLKLDGSRNMTGGLAFTGTSKNITWASDGGGNIGASGANRPSNIYVKDTVYIGGFISIQQNMAWVSDGSGDIGASGNFRPNNIYAKTSVTSSGKAVFTQSNAAAPGYTFGGATNFGMYYDTNTVGLSAQGQAALTCTAATVAAVKPLAMMSGYSLVRTATATNLTVSTSHGLIAVTDTTAARVMTLPAANTVSNRHFIIKDESGSASVSNYIRIVPQSGQLIDGESNYEIVVPYESVIVYSNGTNWFIV
jgi:hypothetical protein